MRNWQGFAPTAAAFVLASGTAFADAVDSPGAPDTFDRTFASMGTPDGAVTIDELLNIPV
jgi:hypothetical protein